MRTCHYCGRKNPTVTAHCSGCGTDITGPPPVQTPGFFQRIEQEQQQYYVADLTGDLMHTPPRRCECGAALRPCHISRRYWYGVIPGPADISYACAGCGRMETVPSRAQIAGQMFLIALWGLGCLMFCPFWFKPERCS